MQMSPFLMEPKIWSSEILEDNRLEYSGALNLVRFLFMWSYQGVDGVCNQGWEKGSFVIAYKGNIGATLVVLWKFNVM